MATTRPSRSTRVDPVKTGRRAAPEITEGFRAQVDVLYDLVLDVVNNTKAAPDMQANDVLTGGEIVQTMDGASSLSLEVHDPVGSILNHPGLQRAVDVKFDNLVFRLVAFDKNDDTLTLTFEDRDVAYVRQHKEVKSASRRVLTRLEFCAWLLKQVPKRRFFFVAPDLHEVKQIGKGPDRRKRPTDAEKDRTRATGIDRNADLKIKGNKATRSQIALMEEVLDVATSISKNRKALLALICANIGEAEYKRGALNPRSKAEGLFQILPRYQHLISPRDIEGGVHIFMKIGFRNLPNRKQDWTKLAMGSGGAVGLAKSNIKVPAGGGTGVFGSGADKATMRNLTPGDIASRVEGSDQGGRFYQNFIEEAEAILDAYGGRTGRETEVAKRQYRKQYRFTTAPDGKALDWWTAIGEILNEVEVRRFMSNGVLYMVSDDDLFRSKARMRLKPTDKEVISLNFSYDVGQPISTAEVVTEADRWVAPPGTTVILEECGPASGKWLVQEVRRGIFDRETTISLRKPVKELPEPETDVVEREEQPESGPRPSGQAGARELKGVTLDRRWQGCQAIFEQFVDPFMREEGFTANNHKRTPAQNAAVGGSPNSDHLTTKKNAYAGDYATRSGAETAKKLARRFGWKNYTVGNYNDFKFYVQGRKFQVQILWAVKGHFDHIHVGIERIG